MPQLQQIIFIIILIIAIAVFTKKTRQIRRNILLGRDVIISNNPKQRWKNVLLLALGQKKMFKNPLEAVLHLAVYAGFIIINAEIIEILLDGILGTHRLFAPLLGQYYPIFINLFETLAVCVLVACVVFLLRRNVLNIKRLISKDLNGWSRSDANAILIIEIILMAFFITMNACDTMLQARGYSHYTLQRTGNFYISRQLIPILNNFSNITLLITERGCWWLHIIGILAFLNYLPYSKHLHIILAFPNSYYSNLDVPGKMRNMPEIQNEVLYAMHPELAPAVTNETTAHQNFGAKDVFDLSWKNLLDSYSCTECGRCTGACPANITGKMLSPRTIVMKTRDRLEAVGANINQNKQFVDDGKSLLHNYISEEELRACTTCNACVEACPVSISPLDIIMQMRRYLILEASSAPQEWNNTFSNIENNFAPWKFSPNDRANWTAEISKMI